uniref:Uncharacterized protein n=1 Tax=Arundo donax TaxID=35708 RepID=A0A0A9ARC4_ARUDO
MDRAPPLGSAAAISRAIRSCGDSLSVDPETMAMDSLGSTTTTERPGSALGSCGARWWRPSRCASSTAASGGRGCSSSSSHLRRRLWTWSRFATCPRWCWFPCSRYVLLLPFP